MSFELLLTANEQKSTCDKNIINIDYVETEVVFGEVNLKLHGDKYVSWAFNELSELIDPVINRLADDFLTNLVDDHLPENISDDIE